MTTDRKVQGGVEHPPGPPPVALTWGRGWRWWCEGKREWALGTDADVDEF